MVQLPVKVRNIIDRYINELNQHNITIKEAVLFGSYAKGNYHEWSDIDIALVSEIFTGDLVENKDKIRKITLSVSSQIEVMPFSVFEFNIQNPLAKEIMATGIKIDQVEKLLPLMTHEKQRHLLNLIPNEYHADASEELIDIIEHSHINTNDDIQDLELLRETRNDKSISFDEYLNGVIA
ncbi:MAG: nucleotidyltransferase domain-containing protein [Desulfamplus sp.]|nr:nucleotidyltransferase domain-containing protein [Desulfamplus sp.]